MIDAQTRKILKTACFGVTVDLCLIVRLAFYDTALRLRTAMFIEHKMRTAFSDQNRPKPLNKWLLLFRWNQILKV